MNGIANFRLCTLTNQKLIEAVDNATDELYGSEKQALKRLVRHVPARPDEDYDLIVGELIHRFADLVRISEQVLEAFEHEIDTTLINSKQDEALNGLKKLSGLNYTGEL